LTPYDSCTNINLYSLVWSVLCFIPSEPFAINANVIYISNHHRHNNIFFLCLIETKSIANRHVNQFTGNTCGLSLNERLSGSSSSVRIEEGDNDFPSFSLGLDFETEISIASLELRKNVMFEGITDQLNETVSNTTQRPFEFKNVPYSRNMPNSFNQLHTNQSSTKNIIEGNFLFHVFLFITSFSDLFLPAFTLLFLYK
jgi:hypothetical protein